MKLLRMLIFFGVVLSHAIANSAPTFEIRPITEKATADTTIMQDSEGKNFFVLNETLATEADLEKAVSLQVPFDKAHYVVRIVFKRNARHKLYDITKKYIKHRLGIIINSRLIIAPEILEPIDGTSFDIVCFYTKAEVQTLVKNLNSAIGKAKGTPNNAIEADAE